MNFEPWLVGITINGVLIALIRNCATDGVMVSALAGLVAWAS